MTDKEIKQWIKERDEAVLSFDIDKLKKFYIKWQGIIYDNDMQLPPDNVLEISIRKMVIGTASATSEQVEQAKKWLKQRGFSWHI